MSAKNTDEQLLAMATKIKESYTPSEIAQLVRLISPTPNTGELSAEEFERVMQVLGSQNNRRPYSSKSVIAARLVLVMGASPSEAAKESGLARQNVSELMLRIRKRMESLPQGWVKVSEWFPGEVAKQIGHISEALKDHHSAGKPLNELSFTIKLTGPTA
ncbi:hypothetical protein A7318_27995 (plasmid) [Pseudomonas lurida]|uniref:TrfB-related DNA-binding protein n=1 Tax=Pseudomonas lurida TaxID=244566 RepID=UPI00083E4A97|nr:TrfB-related DNA-binding protein [Pseudomonas lurida]AOE82489.1 hypothetical protein A7318_27995 [Pseudomonas lurida]